MEKKVYTPKEISSMFNVRIGTVWRWIRSGKLEAFRLGGTGTYRISESALKEFKNETN